MGKKGTPHRKFSQEEKLRIVKMHLEENKSLSEIEREYQIGSSSVARWVKQYVEEGKAGLEPKGHKGNPYAALHSSKRLGELERLLLTVAKHEVEIERLKKGYYVKGAGADKELVTCRGRNLK